MYLWCFILVYVVDNELDEMKGQTNMNIQNSLFELLKSDIFFFYPKINIEWTIYLVHFFVHHSFVMIMILCLRLISSHFKHETDYFNSLSIQMTQTDFSNWKVDGKRKGRETKKIVIIIFVVILCWRHFQSFFFKKKNVRNYSFDQKKWKRVKIGLN